jgi:protein-S-isoprenylcysteine O-methyltransferase Ste14
MTAGHLLFSAGMSVYILIALRYEERDLVNHIGERYVRYRSQVPALVPRPGRKFTG